MSVMIITFITWHNIIKRSHHLMLHRIHKTKCQCSDQFIQGISEWLKEITYNERSSLLISMELFQRNQFPRELIPLTPFWVTSSSSSILSSNPKTSEETKGKMRGHEDFSDFTHFLFSRSFSKLFCHKSKYPSSEAFNEEQFLRNQGIKSERRRSDSLLIIIIVLSNWDEEWPCFTRRCHSREPRDSIRAAFPRISFKTEDSKEPSVY
jgi:hypothetical protein